MKSYIKQKGYRESLGIGYASTDQKNMHIRLFELRGPVDRALNSSASTSTSGAAIRRSKLLAMRTEPMIPELFYPRFFSEYSCNTVKPANSATYLCYLVLR